MLNYHLFVIIQIVLMEFVNIAVSFNLQNILTSSVFTNHELDSSFGYSVTFHRIDGNKTSMLVSAPSNNLTSTATLREDRLLASGGIYRCSISKKFEDRDRNFPNNCTRLESDTSKFAGERVLFLYDFESSTSVIQLDDDDFDWVIHTGPTSSDQTGPSYDHTVQKSNMGSYMLLECSNPRSVGETAMMSTPVLNNMNAVCIRFWYHMRGENMGSLNLYLFTNLTGSRMIWSIEHDQGDMWHEGWVTVISLESYQIIFEGVVGQDYNSDIGLDDIKILDGNCVEDEDSAFEPLGITLSANPQTGQVLTCAPRYRHLCKDNNYMVGMCSLFDKTLLRKTVKTISPCRRMSCSEGQMDLIFVIDGSDSVNVFDFKKMLRWLSNVISALPIAEHLIRVAVVQFSSKPNTEFYLNQHYKLENLRLAIRNIKYMRGTTATGRAIFFVNNEVLLKSKGMRKGANQVVVIITDGKSQDDVIKPAETIKAQGITVFAIGVGVADHEELRNIASDPDEQYVYTVNSYKALDGIRGQIQKKLFALESQGSTFTTQQCEAGISAGFVNDKLIIGLPGLDDWSGGLAIYSDNETTLSKWRFSNLLHHRNVNMIESIISDYNHTNVEQRFSSYQETKAYLTTSRPIEISGDSDYDTFLASGKLFKTYEDEELINLNVSDDYIMETITHSYFGYSISSGSYRFPGSIDIAVGAPRYMSKGSVFIFSFQQDNDMPKHVHEFSGNQMGSYYGYSICMTDMNGDKVDEVLIGAPLMMEKHEDMGLVEVYFSGKPHSSPRTKILLRGSSEQSARFGFAISAADLNQDGFNDVVIGAPSHADGNGAIYIYNGGINLNERLQIPSQIIRPSTLKNKLIYFGFSLHSGQDVDGNGHPDIACGAPGSSKALLILSKPVIHIFAELTAIPNVVNISMPHCNFPRESNDMTKLCIVIQICISGTGHAVSKEINLRYLLMVDSDKQHRNKRGHFLQPLNKISLVTGKSRCTNATLILKKDIIDQESDMIIEMKYNLQDGFLNDSLSPVLNIYDENPVWTKIQFARDCKNKNCETDLKLQCDVGETVLHNNYKSVTLDENQMINMHMNLSNLGNAAYGVLIQVKYNASLYFSRIIHERNMNCLVIEDDEDEHSGKLMKPNTNITKVIETEKTERSTIKTLQLKYYDNVLGRNMKCSAVLQFGIIEGSKLSDGLLKIDVIASSSSRDKNSHDNLCNEAFSVYYIGKVLLTSHAQDVHYSLETNLNNSTSQDSEIVLNISYLVTNQGISTIPKSKIKIRWPDRMKNMGMIMSLSRFECIPSYKCQCEYDSIQLDVADMGDDAQKLKPISYYESDKPVWIKCSNKGTECKSFNCALVNLNSKDTVKIRLDFQLTKSIIIESKTSRLHIVTELDYSSTSSNIIMRTPALNYQVTSTIIKNSQHVANDSPVLSQLWIIVIAVAAGVLALLLMIIIFYKNGFFESKYRRKKEETMEWQDFDKYSDPALRSFHQHTDNNTGGSDQQHKLSTFQRSTVPTAS